MKQKFYLPVLDNGGGSAKANYMVSLIQALSGSGLDIHIARASDSLATRGMNAVTNNFLATDCTDLLVIDCDIICTAQDLINLCSHDVPLVYGVYPKRQVKAEICLAGLEDGATPEPGQLLWEVRRAGRGFVRIRRDLLEKMKEDNGGPALRYHNHGRVEWHFWPSDVVTGSAAVNCQGIDVDQYPLREFISEDWAFCERARALGVPVLVDTRIFTKHEGDCIFPIQYTEDMLPEILSKFEDNMVLKAWQQARLVRQTSSAHSDAVSPKSAFKDWREIPGWFDYEIFYRRLVDEIPEGGSFVEVGCWLGRSMGAFISIMREKGKHIQLHAVDTFKGSETEPCKSLHKPVIDQFGGSIMKEFMENARDVGAPSDMMVHELGSTQAALNFETDSLDAVFLDGDHSEEAVKWDISAWVQKIKPGGILAGHDYDQEGVRKAVQSAFEPKEIETSGRCWIYVKPL